MDNLDIPTDSLERPEDASLLEKKMIVIFNLSMSYDGYTLHFDVCSIFFDEWSVLSHPRVGAEVVYKKAKLE